MLSGNDVSYIFSFRFRFGLYPSEKCQNTRVYTSSDASGGHVKSGLGYQRVLRYYRPRDISQRRNELKRDVVFAVTCVP